MPDLRIKKSVALRSLFLGNLEYKGEGKIENKNCKYEKPQERVSAVSVFAWCAYSGEVQWCIAVYHRGSTGGLVCGARQGRLVVRLENRSVIFDQ